MRICRFTASSGDQHGIIEDDLVYELKGTIFHPRRGRKLGHVDEIVLLPPVTPGKIICVGRNYVEHAQERGEQVPTEPLLFLKPPSSVIGTNDEIELVPGIGKVEHEAELALVIGKKGRFLDQEAALEHVLGYTCANDVSARDYQAKDGQWTRAKGFDTFCPLGPWISTELDPSNVEIRCLVNNVVKQKSSTAKMVFSPALLIAYISRIMTLFPGDLILTGTPAGVSPIHPGDVVEVQIDGIGTLRNRVTAISPNAG